MNEEIKEHYASLFEQHGDHECAVQYSSKDSQVRRFKALLGIDPNMQSVVDVGSGLGHMLEYLLQDNYRGRYLGLDFVPAFIEHCKNKYDTPHEFLEFDLNKDDIPEGYDYCVLSGIFNNKTADNEAFMLQTIEKMFAACKKGVAFNAMSTYVDYQDEALYYSDPLAVFDYVKKHLTRRVALRHDYLVKDDSIPFEYTLYLYR